MLVYLSLGSNIGNRFKNIQTAIKLLKEIDFNIVKTSSAYETSPWGKISQPHFLNLVLRGKTKLSPEELLKKIKIIEKAMGREKTAKWGPRIIDIDILFYGKKIVKSKSLTIPHPQLHKRAFVLVPLKEIAPSLAHPIFKKTITRIYNASSDNGSVLLYNKSAKEEIRL